MLAIYCLAYLQVYENFIKENICFPKATAWLFWRSDWFRCTSLFHDAVRINGIFRICMTELLLQDISCFSVKIFIWHSTVHLFPPFISSVNGLIRAPKDILWTNMLIFVSLSNQGRTHREITIYLHYPSASWTLYIGYIWSNRKLQDSMLWSGIKPPPPKKKKL